MRKLLATAVLSAFALPALAVGTHIPVDQAKDMVYDEARGVVYITTDTQVLRYHVATGSFQSPIGGTTYAAGIDISPDNRFLVVADQADNDAGVCMHVIDLNSMGRQLPCTPELNLVEAGTASVVYGADGKIYATSSMFNSPDIPLRRFAPASGQWDLITDVAQGSILSASGDAQTIAFVGLDYPASQWGFIDVPTGGVVRRPFPQSDFASGIAVDRFGAQFSVVGADGVIVFDDAYSHIGSIPSTYVRNVAYHPVERIAYLSPYSGAALLAYNMDSLQQVGSFDIEAYDRVRLSRDGSLIMATESGGIRIYQQYAPLQAGAVSASTNLGQAKALTLFGSIGNGGSLGYSIASSPSHGSVSLSGVVATYTPAAGYVGADSFSYRVQYGRAVRTATVSMTVVDPNRAPVAVNDSAQTRTASILIPVLANDSDPDGDVLSISSVTVPNAGAAVIQGTKILFTPPKKWPSLVTFDYTIRDGRGKQAAARVTVTRN